MKRRLLIIAVFLLLGAVVNVAVAWGLAVWMDVGGRWAPGAAYIAALDRHWAVNSSERWGFTRVTAWSVPAAGDSRTYLSTRPSWPTWAAIQVPDASVDPSIETWQLSDAFGWPYLAMAASFSAEFSRAPRLITKSALDGVLLTVFDPVAEDGRALPLHPIWPGFALNTLFYATLLWSLIRGPFALRRFLRLRRGLCPKCAYPMGESSVCTECGGALPKKVVP